MSSCMVKASRARLISSHGMTSCALFGAEILGRYLKQLASRNCSKDMAFLAHSDVKQLKHRKCFIAYFYSKGLAALESFPPKHANMPQNPAIAAVRDCSKVKSSAVGLWMFALLPIGFPEIVSRPVPAWSPDHSWFLASMCVGGWIRSFNVRSMCY